MAGFTNAASVIAPAVQGLSIATNAARFAGDVLGTGTSPAQVQRAGQDQALAQLQALQDEELRRAEEDAHTERTRIAAAAENAESTRRAALKRAVARQRANFGASGIEANSSGSAQAVLLGLFDESDEERAQREKLDTLKLGAIDQDLGQRQRLNVLQRTQLAERQRLQQSVANRGRGTAFGRLFGGL